MAKSATRSMARATSRLPTTGTLTNTAGQIGSDQDLSITASTIIGNGQSIAKRDASISLQGNYTNAAGNVLKANRKPDRYYHR